MKYIKHFQEKLYESFSEDFDDIILTYMEDDSIFDIYRPNVRNISFDLLRKAISFNTEDKNKFRMVYTYTCLFGKKSNSDFINSYETIVEAKLVYIDIDVVSTDLTDVINKNFRRIITLYPNVQIYSRLILSHESITRGRNRHYNRYELIFVNLDDYKK